MAPSIPKDVEEFFRSCSAMVNVNKDEHRVKVWGRFSGSSEAVLVAAYSIDVEGPDAPVVTFLEEESVASCAGLSDPSMAFYIREAWLEACPLYPSLWEHLDE